MDTLLRPAVLAPALLVLANIIRQYLFKGPNLPDLPIIGVRKGDWFPLLQAKWRNLLDFKAAVKEAHSLYKDQAALCPVLGMGNFVILPASETQFMVDQPPHLLSMHERTVLDLQTDYTIIDSYLFDNPTHHKLITTTLTSQIGNLIPDIDDEAEWSLAQQWGVDTTSWTEVCVYDTMRKVVGSVTNRVLVGLPSCRDAGLLTAGMAFAEDIPLASLVLRAFWKPLRAVVAPFVTVPNRIHTNRFHGFLKLEIQRRLREYDEDAGGGGGGRKHNDFLQWCINQAKELGDPYMCHPTTLSGRVLLLNFAAIHTSSFSITHAILDLVGSKPDYISELRAEISSVLADNDGQWNKRALAKMVKLDSVLRESARLNSFVTIALGRLVVAEEGITTPSGVHIPKGCSINVPSYSILHDPNVYPDAQEFQPFRFACNPRLDGSSGENNTKRAKNAFATTSNEYLIFGQGRNACPGRFFAANMLKLVLGHLVMDYDFEMQQSRPNNVWFGTNRVPPMRATIKVRRRAKD